MKNILNTLKRATTPGTFERDAATAIFTGLAALVAVAVVFVTALI